MAKQNDFTSAVPVTGVEWTTLAINLKEKTAGTSKFSITQSEISLDWYRNQQKPLWAIILIIVFWTIIICGGSGALIKQAYFSDGAKDDGHGHEGGSKVTDDYYRLN